MAGVAQVADVEADAEERPEAGSVLGVRRIGRTCIGEIPMNHLISPALLNGAYNRLMVLVVLRLKSH